MKITLVTVGKIKEKFYTDAIAEYAKRLSRYCKLEIIQVADEKTPDKASDIGKVILYTKLYGIRSGINFRIMDF